MSATATANRSAEPLVAADRLPLQEHFQSFYDRVVRFKRSVLDAEPGTDAPDPEPIQRELLTLLEDQSSEVRRRFGSAALEIHERAQYVMTALADETFIHLPWTAGQVWRDRLLLEAALFDSYRAGDEIFRRIDQLLAGRAASAQELAPIYLQTLGLGFEGKYRLADDGRREIAGYQQRLLGFIAMRRPELGDPDRRLMAAAYEHTAADQSPAEVSNPRRWLLALLVVGLLWLLVGHLLWRGLIADLEPILTQILS